MSTCRFIASSPIDSIKCKPQLHNREKKKLYCLIKLFICTKNQQRINEKKEKKSIKPDNTTLIKMSQIQLLGIEEVNE